MKYNNYNENKKHGEDAFPIQLYCVNHLHQQYIMPLHWHKELEIIKVNSGKFNLFINNKLYTLKNGDIAFINCKTLHRGVPQNCNYECVVCDLSMMVKKTNDIFISKINPIILGEMIITPVVFKDENSCIYQTIVKLFNDLKNKSENSCLAVMSNLFLMFYGLYNTGMITAVNKSKKAVSKTNNIYELIRWINTNYSENITLDMLAKKSGLTPNYLCRIFKEYTGKTPIEYINFVRIENICYDIKWENKNITEAAIDNGYNDISYFCKVFKKYKGVSAQKYVKEQL